MRLWSQQLIPLLPSKKDYKGCTNQLGGQHTEIRMILGTIKKHGKLNHSTVNYINDYPIHYLYAYGLLIADEMLKRGFNVSQSIIQEYMNHKSMEIYNKAKNENYIIYPVHDEIYLNKCIENLRNKNIIITL